MVSYAYLKTFRNVWFCAYMRGKVYEITACGIDMKTGLFTKFKKYENSLLR